MACNASKQDVEEWKSDFLARQKYPIMLQSAGIRISALLSRAPQKHPEKHGAGQHAKWERMATLRWIVRYEDD